MKLKLLSTAIVALACLSTPALAQRSPLKDGDYVCRNSGKVTGSFTVSGPSTYKDSNGRERTYQYDRGLNVLNFDNGKQYFIGGQDLLVLVENGQLSRHGCVLQKR